MTIQAPPSPGDSGEFILYQTEDGKTRLEVRLLDVTLWLPQRLIGELFQVSVKTANDNLDNIQKERELAPEATIRRFRIVRTEESRGISRSVDHYIRKCRVLHDYHFEVEHGE